MPDLEPHRRVVDILVDRVYNQPLIESVQRGPYVEAMIADALDDEWAMTSTWAEWDLQHVSGARVEIKSKAALQTWTDGEEGGSNMNPSFDIALRKVVSKKTKAAANSKEMFRAADIYVLAWHPVEDPIVADHRLVGQWRFFICAEINLPHNRNSITLNRVEKIVSPVGYHDLATSINEVRKNLASLKKDEYADQPVRRGAGRPKL